MGGWLLGELYHCYILSPWRDRRNSNCLKGVTWRMTGLERNISGGMRRCWTFLSSFYDCWLRRCRRRLDTQAKLVCNLSEDQTV